VTETSRRVSGQGARGARVPVPKWRVTLVVDPTLCDGHGVCAELFPEWVALDPWGFPIIDKEEIPPALVDHARRAVAACPRWPFIWWNVAGESSRASS
jgi:ferredoxin